MTSPAATTFSELADDETLRLVPGRAYFRDPPTEKTFQERSRGRGVPCHPGHVSLRPEDMARLTITGKGKKERKVDIEKALLEAIRSTFHGEPCLFQTQGGKPTSAM